MPRTESIPGSNSTFAILPEEAGDTLRSVVGLDGLGLDGDRGVAFLVELGSVGDGPDDVAGTQSEGSSEGGQCRDEYGDDDFDDLSFVHNGVGFEKFLSLAGTIVFNFRCKDTSIMIQTKTTESYDAKKNLTGFGY